MLSAEQVAHFHTFGFLVLRQAFARDEVETLSREADAACAEKTDRDADGSTYLWAPEFVEERPSLMKVLEDDRIYLSMKDLLGYELIWIGSEVMWGIDPSLADHTWHFDGHKTARHLDYLRTKVMLYLDPQRKDTGALRVIPGSHRDPLHRTLFPLQDAHLGGDPCPYGVEGTQVPSCAVETDPGDIVLFNQWLYHAVYGKEGKRRVIVLKFGPRPRTNAHLAMLRDSAPDVFKPHASLLKSRSPRIKHLIEGMEELGRKAESLA